MKDGLYRVSTSYFVAGFVISNGKPVAIAPILKRKFYYWKKVAVFIAE